MNRWPGAAPLVSYGTGLTISIDGTSISARQNLDLPPLVPQAWSQIFPNQRLQTAHPDLISRTLERNNVEAIPTEILNELLIESRALELPDALDLTVGNKLAFQNNSVVWANNDTLTFVEDSSPVTQINVQSPVLEIDCMPEATVLRSRVGLGVLQNSNISTILEGNTMSMALKNHTVAVTRDTEVNILDVASGKTTLTYRFPRCSLNGFNRLSWGSPNQLFYADHDTVFLLDVRESSRQDQPAHTVRQSRRSYATAVRDIKSYENDIFVLESTGLLWYDARQPSTPLLEVQHFMKRNETSWRLDFLDKKNRSLLLSGPTVPFNTVFQFGSDHDFPVLQQDPYLLELWPSVCVQSQIAHQNTDGKYELYISTPVNGLFKQELGYGAPSQSPQLPADEPLEEIPASPQDFEFFTEPENTEHVHLHDLKRSMDLNMPGSPLGSDGGDVSFPIYRCLGFEDRDDFENYNRAIWLDPMPDWHPLREKFVDKIAYDMRQQSLKFLVAEKEDLEEVDSHIKDLLETWGHDLQIGEIAPFEEFQSTLPSDPLTSDLALGFTQPEPEACSFSHTMSQSYSMPTSQPTDFISLSQPLPKRNKPKRKRARDGFA